MLATLMGRPIPPPHHPLLMGGYGPIKTIISKIACMRNGTVANYNDESQRAGRHFEQMDRSSVDRGCENLVPESSFRSIVSGRCVRTGSVGPWGDDLDGVASKARVEAAKNVIRILVAEIPSRSPSTHTCWKLSLAVQVVQKVRTFSPILNPVPI